MNKKHFLFILPVCLIFCLWFTNCDEEYEQVDDLWEKLKNTVWINYDMYKGNGDTVMIGFYGPRNGPYKKDPDLDKNNPYVVIRGNDGRWYMDGLSFDKTGNEIIFPDMIDNAGNKHTRSFMISVSDDGNELTIKDVKKSDGWGLPLGTYSKISSDPNYNWDN